MNKSHLDKIKELEEDIKLIENQIRKIEMTPEYIKKKKKKEKILNKMSGKVGEKYSKLETEYYAIQCEEMNKLQNAKKTSYNMLLKEYTALYEEDPDVRKMMEVVRERTCNPPKRIGDGEYYAREVKQNGISIACSSSGFAIFYYPKNDSYSATSSVNEVCAGDRDFYRYYGIDEISECIKLQALSMAMANYCVPSIKECFHVDNIKTIKTVIASGRKGYYRSYSEVVGHWAAGDRYYGTEIQSIVDDSQHISVYYSVTLIIPVQEEIKRLKQL